VHAGERDELLVRVDRPRRASALVWRRGEAAFDEAVVAVCNDRDSHTGHREPLEVLDRHGGEVHAGQARRHLADDGDPAVGEVGDGAHDCGRRHRDERAGPARSKADDGQQQHERSRADGQCEQIRVRDDADERGDLFDDAVAAHLGAGQSPELPDDHEDGAPGEISDEQRCREQIRCHAQPHDSGDETPPGDDERERGGQGDGAGGVASGQGRDRGPRHEGDR
jgi:hypothetical protein